MTTKLEKILVDCEAIKPESLNPQSKFLLPVPHPLTISLPLNSTEEKIYATNSINYYPNKQTKQKNEYKWNLDVDTDASEGDFDAEGNFVLKKKPITLWMIEDMLEGPFSSQEMKLKMKKNELVGRRIKRVDDADYFSVTEIENLKDPFDDVEIDKLLLSHSEELVVLSKPAENSIKKEKPVILEKLTTEISSKEIAKLEGCTKSMDYLRERNWAVDIVKLVALLRKMSKDECITMIEHESGLMRIEVKEFLNILINESKVRICNDIDADGFEKVKKNLKKK